MGTQSNMSRTYTSYGSSFVRRVCNTPSSTTVTYEYEDVEGDSPRGRARCYSPSRSPSRDRDRSSSEERGWGGARRSYSPSSSPSYSPSRGYDDSYTFARGCKRSAPDRHHEASEKRCELTCVKCGEAFSLRGKENAWYTRSKCASGHKMQQPKRCAGCRRGGSTAAKRKAGATRREAKAEELRSQAEE